MVLSYSDSEVKGGAAVMDEKQLKAEYRKWRQQETPDLWSRIESNLKEHPDRDKEQEEMQKIRSFQPGRRIFQTSAVAAAAVAAMVAVKMSVPDSIGDKSAWMGTKTETIAQITGGEEAAVMEAGELDTWMEEGGNEDSGVVDEEQLMLAACHPVAVPEDAVTIPADDQYFSEAILKDAQLVCRGTVTDVSLEEDSSGKAVKVVYKVSLDQVDYAEDYVVGMDEITVKSPIVKTDGDEVYILYQLQIGGTYLLPLLQQEGGWELLYPFAPQIQVTGEGGYLFHSGYATLMNDETLVVTGTPQGSNDVYYDRMVLRKDDNFLSEFLNLVELEQGGQNEEK